MNGKCIRCLLYEADRKMYESIAEYVSLIPDDKKSTDELYRKRLDICKNCDSLNGGLCLKCGCYVEIRAAYTDNRCPSENRYW